MTDIHVTRRTPSIAVVTIDRRARRNACNLAAWRDLAEAFETLARDRAVRVVVLTGAAGHFCAGADISEFAALRADKETGATYEGIVERCYEAITALPQPSVAAISGSCVGGGMALALCCDFRVAGPDARFGIPAAKLGTIYTVRETGLLFSVVGLSSAKRILYGGQLVDVATAERLGLVDQRADGDPVEAAIAFAGAMVDNAPLSIAGAKLVLQSAASGRLEQQMDEIQALIDQAMESEDYKEGGRAFLEKRKPVFKGR